MALGLVPMYSSRQVEDNSSLKIDNFAQEGEREQSERIGALFHDLAKTIRRLLCLWHTDISVHRSYPSAYSPSDRGGLVAILRECQNRVANEVVVFHSAEEDFLMSEELISASALSEELLELGAVHVGEGTVSFDTQVVDDEFFRIQPNSKHTLDDLEVTFVGEGKVRF